VGKILGPDSRGMCYFYVPELPDVLVIANDCTKRTLNEKDEHYHVILYCIRHNENLRIMQPSGYKCWYKSGPLSNIPKNLSILMEIYEKNTTSNSK